MSGGQSGGIGANYNFNEFAFCIGQYMLTGKESRYCFWLSDFLNPDVTEIAGHEVFFSDIKWWNVNWLVLVHTHLHVALVVQHILKISTQVNTKIEKILLECHNNTTNSGFKAWPALQTSARELLLYLATIKNGRRLCVMSSIEIPPSPEKSVHF